MTVATMNELPALRTRLTEHARPLMDALEQRIDWQWDDHFDCLLSEFSVDHEHAVFLQVKKHYPHIWDRKTIKKADPFLRHRAGVFGDLVKNQLLLTQDSDGQEDVMLAWWPWGHGATISVRVFTANSNTYVPPSGFWHSIKSLLNK